MQALQPGARPAGALESPSPGCHPRSSVLERSPGVHGQALPWVAWPAWQLSGHHTSLQGDPHPLAETAIQPVLQARHAAGTPLNRMQSLLWTAWPVCQPGRWHAAPCRAQVSHMRYLSARQPTYQHGQLTLSPALHTQVPCIGMTTGSCCAPAWASAIEHSVPCGYTDLQGNMNVYKSCTARLSSRTWACRWPALA